MKNIYGKANNYTTKADGLTILSSYRSNPLKLLKEGYRPFETRPPAKLKKDGSDENTIPQPKEEIIIQAEPAYSIGTGSAAPIKEAFDFFSSSNRTRSSIGPF
ncbi:hypothetical protein ZORO111903_09345 [Zobellia roscoffensis]|uniref:hypothetical protein n=1 Tax=Zobellia roscoffensis TaxID=2779508 RepID=UPI00188D1B03|nr:hypothetical protein [Zobellia roscoffensis]